MRRYLAPFLIALIAFPYGSAAAVASATSKLSTSQKRYIQGQDVPIALTNTGDRSLTFKTPWTVTDPKGNPIASYHWAEDELTLEPGATATWLWDGTPNACSKDGCTKVGGLPRVGKKLAVVRTETEIMMAPFLTGRYFTLGFESRPGTEFVTYVAKQGAVDKMRAEARSEEKTLIVSGIVRLGRLGYNPDWSFYMGPRSIVTGEMFIEVCDGSPYYVQRHRREWKGDRWCPWSSYVKRMGR